MTVVFDLYLFTEEYVSLVKEREVKINPAIGDDFVAEVGSLLCLNTQREIPINFFSIDEALKLIDSGFATAKAMTDAGFEYKQESVEQYPETKALVSRGQIELDAPFEGRFLWDENTKKLDFKSREELEVLLASRAQIKK